MRLESYLDLGLYQDLRRCTTLIGSIQPSRGAARAEVTTAKNVQRGLAQKVQDMSGQFRKKQRVYMQSELFYMLEISELTSELQGHAIKNKDLLAASGAITLKGSDVLDELQEDEQAVRHHSMLQPELTPVPKSASIPVASHHRPQHRPRCAYQRDHPDRDVHLRAGRPLPRPRQPRRGTGDGVGFGGV